MHIPINGYAATVPFSCNYMVPILSLNHIQGLFTHLNCCCTKVMHLAVVTCLVRKKINFRTVFFYKDNYRNCVISIITEHVVNDVHTYISS